VTGPPEDRMTELRKLFFESAGELVENLNDQAMQLEKSPGDAENIRSLRRTVHTLKGDAAACGFRELSELAHELEDVLGPEKTAAASVPAIALRAADIFSAMLEAYQEKKKLPSIQSLREEIARLAHPGPTAAVENKKKRVASRQLIRWSEYEQLAIAEAAHQGKRLYHVTVQLDPQCGMPIAALQLIRIALAAIGEVLAFYPGEGSRESTDRVEVALASEKSAEQIRLKCQIPTIALQARVATLRPKAPARGATARADGGSEQKLETAALDTANLAAVESSASTAKETVPAPVSTGPDSILRVDAERIDSVLNLVGEMILAKSMLQQTLLEFTERFARDPLRGKFADAMAFQARVLNDLQRSVMKIRMVPVDQLFRRFPRVVRDIGLQCGKQVELVVKGEDTDLDKGILDAMAEPLTHLVRNAVGHGIEPAEERVRAGKRAQGMLRLNAYHQGNQVVIEVSDDGHGIDADKVRQRAVSQGLLSAEQAARLTEAETLELVFRPGFSTAAEITELSGRGVGLDVVQSVLGRLKGTVQIDTEAGRGTTFRLRLPLTLAIIKALLFRVEQRLYAIPLNAVAEITRTVEEHIHQVEHYDVLQLRNEVLPLLRLGRAPEAGPASARHKVFVLVINSADRKFGLIVDELVGEDELVIKALDDQSISTDLVSGASILGDGRVVLILNLTALVERFTRARTGELGGRLAGLLSSNGGTIQARGAAGGQE
jgi:two-component system, chemotaxis family, sensor kinase CheA